jgi:hypothetical protein
MATITAPALIGATVEDQLAAVLEALLSDAIGVDDLTRSLAEIYLLGHKRALESVLPELTAAEQERDQYRDDADRLYGLLYLPHRRPKQPGKPYAELEAIRAEIYNRDVSND